MRFNAVRFGKPRTTVPNATPPVAFFSPTIGDGIINDATENRAPASYSIGFRSEPRKL